MIDVCSRRTTGWSVSLAESTLTTIDALCMACEQIGPPAILYCDNGSCYKNELMTAPGTELMARLGIEMKHSIPYNSQAHGIIQCVHHSILIKAAKLLSTYLGAPMEFWNAKVCTDMVVPANELPDLYHPQVMRKVDRGEIRKVYFSNDLQEWHGNDVLVSYNMHNAAKVLVRNQDQQLISVAMLDGNKSHFIPLSEVKLPLFEAVCQSKPYPGSGRQR